MRHAVIALGFGLVIGQAALAQKAVGTAGDPARTASAGLIDGNGGAVGEARLQQTPHGVLVKLDLKSVAPGTHALHIHKIGRCDAPSFESAGAHFDTAAREHGFLNPRGHHTGDVPNIEVPASKQFSVEHLIADVTLDPGPRSLFDTDGSAIVIHAGKDDYATDPAGNAGDRIACGRIAPDDKP